MVLGSSSPTVLAVADNPNLLHWFRRRQRSRDPLFVQTSRSCLTCLPIRVIGSRRLDGNREMESAAALGSRLDPDVAALALDDPLADCEADAGACVILARMESLEHGEDPVGVGGVDADAVVRYSKVPGRSFLLGGDAY